MKFILYIITPARQSTEGFHWALHKCKEGNKTLRFVFVKENGQDADSKIIDEVEKQCRTFQAPFETRQEAGSYADVCKKMAADPDVDLLVVVTEKRNFLKKLFGNSDIQQISQSVSCEMKVYND